MGIMLSTLGNAESAAQHGRRRDGVNRKRRRSACPSPEGPTGTPRYALWISLLPEDEYAGDRNRDRGRQAEPSLCAKGWRGRLQTCVSAERGRRGSRHVRRDAVDTTTPCRRIVLVAIGNRIRIPRTLISWLAIDGVLWYFLGQLVLSWRRCGADRPVWHRLFLHERQPPNTLLLSTEFRVSSTCVRVWSFSWVMPVVTLLSKRDSIPV